jgi:hypothetical protein
MEEEYIQKKIKDKLINTEFKNWNKESINFLISIFEFEKYSSLYSVNLMLLNDYIDWYKINKDNNVVMYELDKLMNIYCIINEDIYYNVHYNYVNIINNTKSLLPFNLSELFKYLSECNFFTLSGGIFLTVIFIIFKYILNFFSQKREEKKNIYELKIPLPDNLISNTLMKLFMGTNLSI